MSVRPFRPEDAVEVTAMMSALWPAGDPYDFSDESIFVWQRDDGPGLGGFVSFSVRAWAEGCESSPVPYIEGWWVAPNLRRSGEGRALGSLRAHEALGFEPTLRLQFFRKRLR